MVTLIATEVLNRQKTGMNYWTIPGTKDTENQDIETLDECIKRVFDVSNVTGKTRKKKIIYARHFERYVLERLTPSNKISDKPRTKTKNTDFKYLLMGLAYMFNCRHSTITHSCRTARNLIETDKHYRKMAEEVFRKIKKQQIIFPML